MKRPSKSADNLLNIKTSFFSLQHLNHFCMDFNVMHMSRCAVKYLSNDILYNICQLHTFRDIVEKNEGYSHSLSIVPGCRCIRKKYIPVCISPYLGQMRRIVDNKNNNTPFFLNT